MRTLASILLEDLLIIIEYATDSYSKIVKKDKKIKLSYARDGRGPMLPFLLLVQKKRQKKKRQKKKRTPAEN